MERDVLVVGEALVDIVNAADGETREYAGGSAANVAVALARLDRPVRFATSFADDDHGRLVAEHLREAGVRLATDPGAVARTSTAAATIGVDGAAEYEFDLEWRLSPVSDEPHPLVVHTCSLGAVLGPGADDVHALLERLRGHATVSYDVNARPAITGTGPEVVDRVERIVRLADVVKASDEDLEALYPQVGLVTVARRLLSLGPAAVVVTRGGDGAMWVGPDEVVEVKPRAVEVADTIGAGDTFGAALLDALWEAGRLGAERRAGLRELQRGEIEGFLAHAGRAAAVTVSRPGADPPYRRELTELPGQDA
jgi:fructokinase